MQNTEMAITTAVTMEPIVIVFFFFAFSISVACCRQASARALLSR